MFLTEHNLANFPIMKDCFKASIRAYHLPTFEVSHLTVVPVVPWLISYWPSPRLAPSKGNFQVHSMQCQLVKN